MHCRRDAQSRRTDRTIGHGWRGADFAGYRDHGIVSNKMLRIPKAVSACGAWMLLWWLPVCADDSVVARAPTWPDTFVARVEAVALLQTLNANLLSHDSATLTLEHWCDVHRLASPARIVAVRVPDSEKPVSP